MHNFLLKLRAKYNFSNCNKILQIHAETIKKSTLLKVQSMMLPKHALEMNHSFCHHLYVPFYAKQE